MSLFRPFSIALALCWIATAACDPDEVDEAIGKLAPPAEKADPAKAAADAAAKQVADAKQAAADGFATCMAGCFGGKAQSPTDRQTCRLTCGVDRLDEGGSGPSPGSKTALARFETCLDADCRKPGSATNAATCRLTCAQAALAGGDALPLVTTARGCGEACLEHVGDCDAACKGNADDVATCRAHCSSQGQRCLFGCEEDPSARPRPDVTPPEGKAAGAVETKAEPVPSVPKKTLEKLPAPE